MYNDRIKQDSTRNGEGVEKQVLLQHEREASLVMLRVSPSVCICVPPEKATPEYAKWYYDNRIKPIR
jgi:hypothetical protein